MRIAIQGAGIAGPTLAYWLSRSGHEVLLVEKSPELRRGGYVTDFWGIGYDVAEKMALLPQLRAQGYRVREVRLVDRSGRRNGGFDVEVSLLAGEGTGLAMAEAYVLAGELRRAGHDHAAAFARYEERMAPLLKRKQKSAARFASSFAPKTSLGVAFRKAVTRLLRVRAVADFFVGRDLRDAIELPEYGL
jgi:2-polyprenyl-6-methoxyphenol hydroxylase-like FAD-dependent oxidoreductase